jgi:hypothetical protein
LNFFGFVLSFLPFHPNSHPDRDSYLQEQEEKMAEIWQQVSGGLSVTLTFWGGKNVGKSWTANTLLALLLDSPLSPNDVGQVPLPSYDGTDDGSPWPVIIR